MFIYITTAVMPPFVLMGLTFMLIHEIHEYIKGDK